MVNFNQAVEVDCRPLAVASTLNGVIASRAADGTSPDAGDEPSSRLDSSGAV
jgi:hypothetical protein